MSIQIRAMMPLEENGDRHFIVEHNEELVVAILRFDGELETPGVVLSGDVEELLSESLALASEFEGIVPFDSEEFQDPLAFTASLIFT